MELKRRELIQQIYNARRLLRDIHIGFKLSIEVSIEGNLWVYAQSVKGQFAITWHPEERLHTMIGELVTISRLCKTEKLNAKKVMGKWMCRKQDFHDTSQAYISKRLAEETVETVERTTITIKAPGFVFGAAICISVAGLIAIGFCVGLLF